MPSVVKPISFISPQRMQQPQLSTLPPLSLYVHIPWCIRKCPYCDFNSHQSPEQLPEDAYIDALCFDLTQQLPMIWGRTIHTIFFGGGTPSLFSAQAFDRLLSHIRALIPLAADAEITLEANPGTFESDKFKAYRALGINRLSIGIQSFDTQHLKILGRVHNADEAMRAIEIAHSAFDNINLDLMYALPQQTVEQAEADLATAIRLQPTHLSLYHLTLEPNTYFAKHPPSLPDEETTEAIEQMLRQNLGDAGYQRYEISAYAQSDQEAKHNLNYWRFGDYIGIGAGAHSKISFPERIVREIRVRHPQQYLEACAKQKTAHIAQHTEVDRSQRAFEFMLNALRLTKGFDSRLFFERTGIALFEIETALAKAEQKGLLKIGRAHV